MQSISKTRLYKPTTRMQKTRSTLFSLDRWFGLLMPILAVIAGLAVGAVILAALGTNPVEAYRAMFVGAFGNKNGLADVLVVATPLLLVALGTLAAVLATRSATGGSPVLAVREDW